MRLVTNACGSERVMMKLAADTQSGGIEQLACRLLNSMLGLNEMNRLYGLIDSGERGAVFYESVLRILGCNMKVSERSRQRIPEKGPVIVIANHPYGIIEPVALAAMLMRVRLDVKFLANRMLNGVCQSRGDIIPIDPFGGPEAARFNYAGLKESLLWLKAGGMLVIFPAGGVSHLKLGRLSVTDSKWNNIASRFAKTAECPILPVYFNGTNGAAFQATGLFSAKLRTAMLPRAFLKMKGRDIECFVGGVIPYQKLYDFKNDDESTLYLRARTYMLKGSLAAEAMKSRSLSKKNIRQETVADPVPADALKSELDGLDESHLLLKSGRFSVYCAPAAEIPKMLCEIGRSREETFRLASEGTGKGIDLDRFDNIYRHLFIWNEDEGALVGAYRLGLCDEIVDKHGTGWLYTSTLFDYKDDFFRLAGPAIELGRSFVVPKYQKSYQPLLLLWSGIGRFVLDNPAYSVLFGPVSISNAYSVLSRRLMYEHLKRYCYRPDLAAFVRAKNPPRWGIAGRGGAYKKLLASSRDIEKLSAVVAEIEHGDMGVPVLIRQYLKLGGRILGFNVDSEFSNVLDGLIIVDLANTDRKTLERYMGKPGAEEFLRRHKTASQKIA